MKKAVGQRGSWFAKVDGYELPCVHKYWLKGLAYCDPFVRHAESSSVAKIHELVDAIVREKRVVLTDDTPQFDRNGALSGFVRKSYIAVYEVDGVLYDDVEGLQFRLVKRLDDLE